MQSARNNSAAVPLDDREHSFYLIVSDLVSLIDRVQASIKLIEAAKALEAAGEPENSDVIVLDDVTPLYAQAGAALDVCNVSLSTALQFLLDTKPTISQA
jgi:hypothetical protein